jgi:predicted ATP-binding protein involved in virulence
MKIRQISVNGLFGVFDHVIPLNIDDGITIIHAPNGFGKTAILKMVNAFFNSQYSVFRSIPFSVFRVEFDNNSNVEVVKDSEISDKSQKRSNINFNFHEPYLERKTFALKRPSIDFSVDILDELIPEIQGVRSSGGSNWRYIPTGEILSLIEVIDRFEDILYPHIQSKNEPKWLENLKSTIHVRLIESQRLLNLIPSRSPTKYLATNPISPTVSAYSDELAQLIKSKFTEYGATAQSLDRTFPMRMLQHQLSHDLTDTQLLHQISELEETRVRLTEIGLLDKDENSNFEIQPQSIDDSTKNMLSVYVEDVEKKLNIFNEIATKINLLRTIVNKKFSYSYKEMNFNKEKGFVFKTLSSTSNMNVISPTDLSSGEQHEVVLLYELLFKVEPNSLVLIDEPELSLHVGWQSQFLKDLQDIIKLVDLDVLMATHSPDIIQDRWDLTVELKGLAK